MNNYQALESALGLLTVLLVASLALYVVLRRRIDRRRKELSEEIGRMGVRAEERAHNQIGLADAELSVLAREGRDVRAHADRLSEARSAFARKDPYEAYRIAHRVHEHLVAIRRGEAAPGPVAAPSTDGSHGPRSDGAALPAEPIAATFDGGTGGEGATPPSETLAPRQPLPKNRMESQFQIARLAEELAGSIRAEGNRPETEAVNRLAADAKARFAAGEYTDALRLALRARRLLGGAIESLPPTRPTDAPDPAAPRRAAADGARCPACRSPRRPTDAFCRSCGASFASRRCPHCQTELDPSDRFCAGCGAAAPIRSEGEPEGPGQRTRRDGAGSGDR